MKKPFLVKELLQEHFLDLSRIVLSITMNKQAGIFLLVSMLLIASLGLVGGSSPESETIQLEVKEPLEILPFNPSLSLFPGETLEFNVTVQNHASMSYNACLSFSLNDTAYEKYVEFSNTVYEVDPGISILGAWLSVSSTAPASKLEITVDVVRDVETAPSDDLATSIMLFAAGTRWAAKDGTLILYVNWYDNYCAHHFSDGADWGPYWGEQYLGQIKNKTVEELEQQGFTVTCVGDVPDELSSYDLVVFEAWFAVEPKHTQVVRDYLANGGNVVVIGGVPCYFATYCKDMWPYVTGGQNLSSLQDWFGSTAFVNTGGSANLVVDGPFGASLENQSQIYYTDSYGCWALTSMDDDAQIIARWSNGPVFAFTHEYGSGRVYYQS